MDHGDHVALLRPAIGGGGRWADIGAGEGAFALALADLLGPGGRIVAVDRDRAALERAAEAVTARFPDTTLTTIVADFTRPLALPAEGPEDMSLDGGLDGLVAANSLHFVPRDRQVDVVRALASLLRPGGRFTIVEYDADRGNPWVPNPFSSTSWVRLAEAAGLVGTHEIGRVPSRFLRAIYSAVSDRP
jgi:SAM-dependent methyltransferase